MRLSVLSVAYPLAQVRPDAVGGAEQVLAQLDSAFVAAGHHSTVIAAEGSQVAGGLVPVCRPDGELTPGTVTLMRRRTAQAIRRTLGERHIDIVHMHGVDFHHYLPPPGPPMLATLHLPLRLYPREALFPARPASWLNCVSASQHRAAGTNPHLLAPIENGVPMHHHRPLTRRGYALMLSRICPEKGILDAIEAAKLAGVPLLIAGEVYGYPEHRRYFEQEVAPRLDASRRFIGAIGGARKRRLLAAARCVLVPSHIPETSSLVAREALAAGTPVIAYRRGALPEAVEHGRTGFLVHGIKEMAGAIRAADSLSPSDCLAAAQERFSISHMIDGYIAAYVAILGRAMKPSSVPGAA
jgi:glycosyltransferase involved in cell wall biosynthesis